ncbi:RNA polymerase II mediator complex subunit [Elasticomyces elasticus]|nr:RNA polymerase II mediator complex subunit [Elasticomyces elasticus]KAK3662110.1 RNA polymerase II mediator complex subunit [Elasticomyces elasticus]KAK4927527.1 RNA polymerase II mediator complex subunit [Elasticomyces elasticus]KAK5743699.1 RNA polymerase II mediator complex subunit [Elasticomyces elasticus]
MGLCDGTSTSEYNNYKTITPAACCQRELGAVFRKAADPAGAALSVEQRQPAKIVDLTDGSRGAGKGKAAYSGLRENVVTSPEVVEIEDEEEEEDDGGPPAKRAKTTTDGFRAENEDGDVDVAHAVIAGEQLPSLPRRTAQTIISQHRYGGADAASRKANGMEPPALATRLPPPKNVADFSPWTGHHPEDVLNEAVVKAGYCDKGPGQTEYNSAKPSIWPNLTAKNNTGLQMLNYLFTQVMEKRQVLGKCTAPSTFKPPPRVTVTDTKREAWLKDLANPEIPLRKQSRTIPHGIRGKLLMDQCLNKDVPLQRAVWLAKCVGANELRAFKRKGVSGVAAATNETKWVHEWTVHVEQFLEGVIESCSQQDWQMKMTYAVKLATAFYSERLLDADHYLDWIVSSFNEVSMERLPIWIIMVQIFWKDLVGFIRGGRRLAEGILERLHTISAGDLDVNSTLKLRLQKLIAVLAVTRRGCLVIPATWKKYKYLLAPSTEVAEDANKQSPAHHLLRRNERMVEPLCKMAKDYRCPRLRLYSALDTTGLDVDLDYLTRMCEALVSDGANDAVAALLDWASSPFRQGLARVYLAARLIAQLRIRGHDTDWSIVAYLSLSTTTATATATTAGQDELVYKVIVEMFRMGDFDPGSYVNWLMSSNAMNTTDLRRATGLLLRLPATQLAPGAAYVRHILLSRLEIDASQIRDTSPKILTRDMDLHTFCALRDSLALANDISALAEVVLLAATTDVPREDSALLSTVVDTAILHSHEFAAMGQFQQILDIILGRYRVLRSRLPLDRTLILSLTSLLQFSTLHHSVSLSELAASPRVQFRSEGMLTYQMCRDLLANDLLVCDQQNTAAVTSPASDNLIGMQASSLELDEDIDSVFASGNTMDEQLLHRLFVRIIARANKTLGGDDTAPTSKLCSWLNQLRLIGGSSFDALVRNYCHSALKGNEEMPQSALIALVASGCVSLDEIVKPDAGSYAANLAKDLLLPMDSDTCLSPLEKYRYRAAQQALSWRQGSKTLVQVIAGVPWWCIADPHIDTTALGMATQSVIAESIQSGDEVWPELLSLVDDSTKKGLHEWAQKQLLSTVAILLAGDAEVTVRTTANAHFALLQLTYSAISGDDDTALLVTLAEKFREVERLAPAGDPGSKTLASMDILRLICTLHVKAPDVETEANMQARVTLLEALCAVMVLPHIQAAVKEHLYDIAAQLSDGLPQAILATMIDNRSDPGVTAILGNTLRTSNWLALTYQVMNSGGTAQQRALAKHASTQASSSRAGVLQSQSQRAWPPVGVANRTAGEERTTPFPVKQWENLPDPTPSMGENDASLSLNLFGARKS